MGSRGSEFSNSKNIENAKDWNELKDAVEKSLSGNMFMSDKFKDKANFEVVKKGMKAIAKMVKKYPILKGHDLVLDWGISNATMNGMTAFGKLTYYSGFYRKLAPQKFDSEIASYGHPKNFDEEQCLAHEIGHYIEGLMLQKMNPGASDKEIVDLYKKDAGFTPLFKEVMTVMHSKGFTGTEKELCGMISKYGEVGGFSEAGAEAIADVYTNSNNAEMVSKVFVEVLEKKLRSL